MPDYIDITTLPWVMEILIPEFIKLLFLMILFFYWIPSKVFPQIGMVDFFDKVMFNILYMTLYIETVIPLMLVIKIFSFPLFLVFIVVTKLLMMKFYEKMSLRLFFINLQNTIMIAVLDALDDLPAFFAGVKRVIYTKVREKWQLFSWLVALQITVFTIIFLYPVFLMTIRGFLTFTYGIPDSIQFVEWVSSLFRGELFYVGKTFGADFYGTAIFAFFLANISNGSVQVVFSLYPFFVVFFLLFGLFYFVQKMTDSVSTGLFSVFLFGVVFMSPLIDYFVGSTYNTSNPIYNNFFGLHLYLPWPLDSLKLYTGFVGMIPYTRNSCGLPYEIAYTFFLPNLYFLIKALSTNERHYIWWYGITLMLMFTFHGGIAFFLVAASIPIAFWAIINGKVTLQKLKLGGLAIIIGAVAGNAWLLSIIKYGGLGSIGAAAPIIDTTLQRLGLGQKSADRATQFISDSDLNFETIQILLPSMPLLLFLASIVLLFVLALIARRRFEWGASALVAAGVLFIYTATIFGIPKLVDPTRAVEALLLSWSMIAAFYFYILIVVPFSRIVHYKAMQVLFSLLALVVAGSVAWITPKWIDQGLFWKELNGIEYPDFGYCTYKIKRDFQPFSWTIISYDLDYAEVLTKGYHTNTQDFISDYYATDRYVRIPTPIVFFYLENNPHHYAGMGEWYYRWRETVQENFQEWIIVYQLNHPGRLKVWYQSGNITVYKLDNRDYIDELFRQDKLKNEKKERAMYHDL